MEEYEPRKKVQNATITFLIWIITINGKIKEKRMNQEKNIEYVTICLVIWVITINVISNFL